MPTALHWLQLAEVLYTLFTHDKVFAILFISVARQRRMAG